MIKIDDFKTNIFADGADLKSIQKLNEISYISGFTTNPSLMRKAGVEDYKKFAQEVLKIIKNKSISFEVFSDELDEMESQAREIASWGENVYVKIPITNSKGLKTSNIINKLTNDKIKCNITALLTYDQVREVYEVANPDTKIIISIFAGRIADTGLDPMQIMKDSINLCKPKKNIEILWASTREVLNVFQANSIGCHIITVPHSILEKFSGIGKNLEKLSLETVQGFLSDAQKSNFKIEIKKGK